MEPEEKVARIKARKGKVRIAAMTAYDYPTAQLVGEAGLDLLLVGDSLGVVVLGYENPLSVTMEEMLHHTRAVARGTDVPLIIGDMPVDTYRNHREALENARLFLEAGAEGVKVEGPRLDVVEALTGEGIPTLGHIGLTPQTIKDYKVQGRDAGSADRLLGEAKGLEKAGAFAIVLECVPEGLGKRITEAVGIPTLGIGAGRYTDGQILVMSDLLGLFDRYVPKFARQYLNLRKEIRRALEDYRRDVESGRFPGEENVYR